MNPESCNIVLSRQLSTDDEDGECVEARISKMGCVIITRYDNTVLTPLEAERLHGLLDTYLHSKANQATQ